MLSLSEDQVRRLADADSVIAAIRVAFSRDFSQTLRMPVRSSLPMEAGGVLLLMPAYDSYLGIAGVKTVTVTRQGGVNANYELIDPLSGSVRARMEANWLTDIRTAATSAVATSILARDEATTLGVFGTGRQAESHIAVLPRVRKFARVLVCGSSNSDVPSFSRRMRDRYKLEILAADAETCTRESDVICTCTTSRVPVLDGRWIKPGTHLNLIGAFQPDTREIDDETVLRSRVVVDTYDGCMAEAGDILIPLKKEIIKSDRIVGDLHHVISGKRIGRSKPDDITLFKSVGCALEDLVTARLVYDRAIA